MIEAYFNRQNILLSVFCMIKSIVKLKLILHSTDTHWPDILKCVSILPRYLKTGSGSMTVCLSLLDYTEWSSFSI